jgi:16S rRNA U1498 N3-methylase RsmE
MKKGKYVDIYVIMACISGKKQKAKLQHVNKLLNKACENCSDRYNQSIYAEMETADAEAFHA